MKLEAVGATASAAQTGPRHVDPIGAQQKPALFAGQQMFGGEKNKQQHHHTQQGNRRAPPALNRANKAMASSAAEEPMAIRDARQDVDGQGYDNQTPECDTHGVVAICRSDHLASLYGSVKFSGSYLGEAVRSRALLVSITSLECKATFHERSPKAVEAAAVDPLKSSLTNKR